MLIIDDQALVREMLSWRLAQEPDLEVLGTAEDAAQGLELAQQLRPDLITLDIDMPGLSPFELARRVREELPDTRIFFLSSYLQDGYISQAMQVRPGGYVTKGETSANLLTCLRKVLHGGTCFCPEIRKRLENRDVVPGLAGGVRVRIQLLTQREREVLTYLGKGLAKKEIARLMGLSVKTVDQHCTHLMLKLDIHDRVELALFAIREGLVRP
ncbi:MAG TPA: response regulator transcription factor [Chromatiaceae bacterium]|nr:response regulator transcription factor [Chromatiaceae bacterium]